MFSPNQKHIDSWDPFNWAPRTRWYQALYVGLTWGTLALGLWFRIIAFIVGGH